MDPRDVSHISHQYHEALRAYVDPVALGIDLQPALQLGTLAVDAGLDTLDMARIHDLAMKQIVPAEVAADQRLRASAFFAEAITPIESTHRSAQEAKQKIERLSDTLALSNVELAEIQQALREGISMREGSEAALKISRDTFEILLKESRMIEVHLRGIAHQSLTGQEEERRRLSLQLHDEISQTVLGIHVRLHVLKKEIAANQEGLSREIVITQGLLEESVQSINRLILKFCPPHA